MVIFRQCLSYWNGILTRCVSLHRSAYSEVLEMACLANYFKSVSTEECIVTVSSHSTQERLCIAIVHPESFRSNAQNAIAFAPRNRPCVNRSGEFACVYLRLRAFASTVCDRASARTCDCVRACDRTYVNSIFKAHQIKLHVHCQQSRSFISFVLVTRGM